MVTAFATTETAIAAMKRGAYDYLTKPFKVDELGVVIERALEKRALLRDNLELRAELRGASASTASSASRRRSSASSSCSSGWRRPRPRCSSPARAAPARSWSRARCTTCRRARTGPFVAVNCGAIPDALLESELFGHEKGAFTGAHADKQGLFAAADGGTLLLDEIGELSRADAGQAPARAQERTVKPVGGVSEEAIDVRVVAATNRDLDAEVERGGFRRDLFYRLNVIQLELPPLRERREDIPLLVEHFVKKHAAALGRAITGVEPDALAALVDYDFPGNVRELENLIERAVTLETGRAHHPRLLARADHASARPGSGAADGFPDEGLDLERVVADYERDLIAKALERAHGVRKSAAKLLGISFRSLRYRLAKLGFDGAGDGDGEDETPT